MLCRKAMTGYIKTRTAILSMVLFVVFMNLSCFDQHADLEGEAYRNPRRFEEAIQSFEAEDRKHRPPQGAIVCVGSSSIRRWSDIKKDLAPLTIIHRGFGGSNMNDALYYADRIVIPYRPRAVVVYEGDNDIAHGIIPERIVDTFRLFVWKVHQELPECRIYFLSIKPSIKRWSLWSKMNKANRLIAAQCAKDSRLTFVDVASGMLDRKGNPRTDIFVEDKLHMTKGGYEIWRDTLRPILIKNELH